MVEFDLAAARGNIKDRWIFMFMYKLFLYVGSERYECKVAYAQGQNKGRVTVRLVQGLLGVAASSCWRPHAVIK